MTKQIEPQHWGCPEYPESCPACREEITRREAEPFWEAELRRLFGHSVPRRRFGDAPLPEFGVTPIEEAGSESGARPE